MTLFDWASMIPDELVFNHVTTTEVVAWDPEEDEEVRYSKSALLGGDAGGES